jgi:HD superfamily phosphohydrolase YqeK
MHFFFQNFTFKDADKILYVYDQIKPDRDNLMPQSTIRMTVTVYSWYVCIMLTFIAKKEIQVTSSLLLHALYER